MPIPHPTTLIPASAVPAGCDLLIVPCDRSLQGVPAALRGFARERVRNHDFDGSLGSTVMLYPAKRGVPSRIQLIGIGAGTTAGWMRVGGIAAHTTQKTSCATPAIMLPKLAGAQLESALLGFQLGQWQLKQTSKKPKHLPPPQCALVTRSSSVSAVLRRATRIADAVLTSRRLSNAPASAINPTTLEAEIRELGKLPGITVEVWDDAKLAKERMGAIRAVGAGSAHPPRLAIVRMHAPNPKLATVLVGKGVCFDSGGYNLKPTGSIEEMYEDMTGAATIIGAIRGLSALGSTQPVIALFPLVENLISGTAYKPSDILTTRSGITIEVNNTDAEGRLILADALALASEWKPKRIIDLATLTGAALVALGDRFNVVLSANDALAHELIDAGVSVDEPVWRLPLHPDYARWMEGKRADMRNISRVPVMAGAITAAEFLRAFVDASIPYAHIDLAASLQHDVHPPFVEGCNGQGVRTLIAFIRRLK